MTKNFGPVAIFHKGPTPPDNKELLWKDSNFTPSTLKEWSASAQAWLPTGANVTVEQITQAGGAAPQVSMAIANPVRQKAGNAQAGATVITWQVTRPAGCGPITAITVGGVGVAPTGDTQSGSTTVTTPLNVDTVHAVVAATATNDASTSAKVTWLHKRLFFAVPKGQNVAGLSDAGLSALLNGLPAQNWDLGLGITQPARSFTGTAGAPVRVYEAILDPSGSAQFRVNGVLNTAWQARTFRYTNSDGLATDFQLYVFLRDVTGKLQVDTY